MKKTPKSVINAASGNNQEIFNEQLMMPQVSENIKSLITQKGITQKTLASVTGYSESCISEYKKGEKLPPLGFFLEIKKHYGIAIDDFLTKNINPTNYAMPMPSSSVELKELEDYQRFSGTYYVYYFDTSKYKGRDYNTASESLMFGILHIYSTPSPVSPLDYSCISVMGFSCRSKIDEIKAKIEMFKDNNNEIEEFITTHYPDNAYYGDFELSQNHAFLSITHRTRDKALMIFHRPPSNKPHYSGGIGTINSVSKGREPMPALQFIALSRNKVTLSDEEIQRLLLLSYPSCKSENEADELITTIKNLYIDTTSTYGNLTDLQKKVVVKADLERFLRNNLENNIFRVAKISNRDDDDWYHGLRDAFLSDKDSE